MVLENETNLTTIEIKNKTEKNYLLAGGDVIGKIKLWYFNSETSSTNISTFHWHAHQISTLKFTNLSFFLLSAGQEVFNFHL
jgi:hypothetical protein